MARQLACSLIVFGTVWLWAGQVQAQNQPPTGRGRPPATMEERQAYQEMMKLVREGDLHKLAVASGGRYVNDLNQTMAPGISQPPSDLEFLGRSSELVVVGQLMSMQPTLTDEGRLISTYALVRVEHFLKGSGEDVLMVKVLGGTVTFADGSVAEVRVGARPPKVGARYLLFLQRDRVDLTGTVFVPTVGVHGVFDVTGNGQGRRGQVQPHAPVGSPLNKLYTGRDVDRFFEEARVKALAP